MPINKEGDKFIRSDEEIKRQIDLVLNSGKNIPPELYKSLYLDY